MASDGTCIAPVMVEKNFDQNCNDFLPGVYHYSGCVNRTISSCSNRPWELQGSGTCINSKSGETCTFFTDSEHAPGTEIASESIKCPSCSADYYADSYYGPPHITDTCNPTMCMNGCPSNKHTNQLSEREDTQESCSQCLAEEQQMFSSCQQICQAGFSYQACKSCSDAVNRKEAYCQSICGSKTFGREH